jgi:hypothetical protein
MRASFLCSLALLLLLAATLAGASCWTAAGYHAAAATLATGLGAVGSSGVCLYSLTNRSALDKECPPPCRALIMATWGSCYKIDPSYQPESIGSDSLVYNMTVCQMFQLVGTPKWAASAYCRAWMQGEASSWKC